MRGPGRLGVGIFRPKESKIFRNLLASIVIKFIHPDPGSEMSSLDDPISPTARDERSGSVVVRTMQFFKGEISRVQAK